VADLSTAPATRIERDTLGPIEVPMDALWGAETQRSLTFFRISTERMPPELLRALTQVKQAAARVNGELGLLDGPVAQAIVDAADEVLAGHCDEAFPLSVWQTGSGTQTHMNLNEVLGHVASIHMASTHMASHHQGEAAPHAMRIDPHDHVNLGQSTNDVFPTAMHLAAVQGLSHALLPALGRLQATLTRHAAAWADIVKIGRTHLQDATPLRLGEEVAGWAAQLAHAHHAIARSLPALFELAIGGTAVGNGLNTHPQFGPRVAEVLAQATGLPLRCAPNRCAAQAAHDGLVQAHGALRTLAVALMKVANDVRWLASGPRCGLGELSLPANEPGSSMMPGKVNPTQCEALTMLCCQVMGNDVAIGFAGASGQFELNAYKPVIAHNVLQSIRLLSDGMASFDTHCASGMAPDRARMADLLQRSLMLVTALVPHIGHAAAAAIAQQAQAQGTSLREAALSGGAVSAADFDAWVQPQRMASPPEGAA
jgi:fumarate hydratase, class II